MNVNFYTEVVIDETTVSSLTEMGFPFEACRKAVYHTKNAGVEPAMNWVMEHMGDPGKTTLLCDCIIFSLQTKHIGFLLAQISQLLLCCQRQGRAENQVRSLLTKMGSP